MLAETSKIGSPNISLLKNFDRNHYYKGYYLIRDTLKEKLDAYLPINHLKISTKCTRQMIDGLKTLSLIDKSDDAYSVLFIGWLWEYKNIDDISKVDDLTKKLHATPKYNARVVFLSIDEMCLLKDFIRAYIYYYDWSTGTDSYGDEINGPNYDLECLNNLNNMNLLLANMKAWLSIESKKTI